MSEVIEPDNSLFYHEKSVEDRMAMSDSFPRFAFLARKALSYYAGERYNPHLDYSLELFTRFDIKTIIEHKVLHRLQAYDWDYIDNLLKLRVANYFNIELDYDLARVNKGFAPDYLNPFKDHDKSQAH